MTGEAADPDDKGIEDLIEAGAEVAGAAAGGAIGFVAAGPAGGAIGGAGGAVVGHVLKRLGREVSKRLLGPREQVRVGGVLALTASEVAERLKQGHSVRTDGFFDRSGSGRSDAEEVAESVLLKSQREPEERKLPYMAHLLAGVAFDAGVSPQLAHQIVKTADDLTYRQLCILKLAAVRGRFPLRSGDYRNVEGQFSRDLYQVFYECLNLYHRGLINFGGEVAFGPTDVNPGNMQVQGLGVDIVNLMQLIAIPDDELAPLVEEL